MSQPQALLRTMPSTSARPSVWNHAACVAMAFALASTFVEAQTPPVPNTPPSSQPNAAERQVILDTARGPAEKELGKPVVFVVKQLSQQTGWAFLRATLQGAGGQPWSYRGTRYQEAAEHGLKSDDYVALLQQQHGSWVVREYRIGPTDVAWVDWSRRYGAPAALFEIPHSP